MGARHWTDQFGDLAGRKGSVYIFVDTVDTHSAVIVGAKSRPGTCFWLRAVADSDQPRFARNACVAKPAAADFGDSWD